MLGGYEVPLTGDDFTFLGSDELTLPKETLMGVCVCLLRDLAAMQSTT